MQDLSRERPSVQRKAVEARAPTPHAPLPPTWYQDAPASMGYILTSGGCNLERDRDLLPDRQWEACLPSQVPD